MAEEVSREMTEPNPVEEYDTEYDESFGVSNFTPSIENIPKESELHKKYPLYTGASVSFYQGNMRHLVGITRSVDPLAPVQEEFSLHQTLAGTTG